MCRVQEWLLTSCFPFVLSLFDELYRGKRVSLVIVNALYLLALILSIISSNIYTRLAVRNCLSFTLRSVDSPSLLMAIFLSKIQRKHFPWSSFHSLLTVLVVFILC